MRRYSEHEIDKMKQNKYVNFINESRLEFTLTFKKMMYEEWEKNKCVDCIRKFLVKHDIDIKIVRRDYIKDMQKQFRRRGEPVFSYSHNKTIINKLFEKYKTNPYIKRVNKNELILKDIFYNETYILKDYFHINDILKAYLIDYKDFEEYIINLVQSKYKHFKIKETEEIINNKILLQIYRNKYKLLEEIVDFNFNIIKEKKKTIEKKNKRIYYKYLYNYPKDIYKKYSLNYILKKLEISKSTFYKTINNETYYLYIEKKEDQDKKDINLIKDVLNYYDYPIGTRMISMQLKRIYNIKFNRKKVLRLCEKFNVKCDVRKMNIMKEHSRFFMQTALKENILKRKFKIAKPLTHLLTDVTYLQYNNQTSYLSPIKDAVTGRILSYYISNNNNVDLIIDSFSDIDECNIAKDAILHSDQGTVYLNQRFQIYLESKGMKQSMSKRGNCWDNASMESFFGHLKDECDYSKCKNIIQLRDVINKYIYYYNYNRPQWNRNKMTPIEYEIYLLNLSPIEYEKYLDDELKKYDIMKENAKKKAIISAKNLGI